MDETPRSKQLKSIIDHLKEYPEEQKLIKTLLNEKYMNINEPVMQLAYITIHLAKDAELLASTNLSGDCIELCNILGVNQIDVLNVARDHARTLNQEIHDILLENNHKEVN